MRVAAAFFVSVAIALVPPVILGTNDPRLEALLDSVPWFIVEKYQDDSSNKSDIGKSELRSTTNVPTENKNSANICVTRDCKEAAENFITNMDTTVDPCDDFFGYVCGGWPSAHPLPPTDSSCDQFSTRNDILNKQIRDLLEEEIKADDIGPVKSAKRAHKACMNTDAIERRGIEPILSILEENGGWPIIMDASRRPHGLRLTWQQIEENYSREYETDSIYGIMVDVDLKNASVYAIYLDQASTIFPRSMMIDPDSSPALLADYTKYVADVAHAFAEAKGSRVSRNRIMKDAKAIVKFETEIAKISSPDEMRRDFDRLYNSITIQQFQNWYARARPKSSFSKVNWLKTIQNQFNDLKINVESTEKIVVMEMDYYFKLVELLDNTPHRTVVNYIHWRMVNSLLPSTTKQMRDITFEIEKKVFGVREQRERWMSCVTSHDMKHAISYQYVNKYVTDVAKKWASEMVTEIQDEFSAQISLSQWMEEPTKVAAKEKLHAMRRFISHPDWYQNQTAMIHFYKGLIITQDHFSNVMNYKKYDQRKKFKKYGTPVQPDEWSTEPITINAFYDPNMNSLTFPAGILQVPFFSPEVPDALNYGSIGAVIGHEISHGFDDVGRQFDKDGNAKQWWSDKTIKNFQKRAQCFIDQFNNYTIEEISTDSRVYHSNGELNQGENIADSTGLQASYEIFKRRSKQRNSEEPRLPGLENITPEQLFFIAYGNTWCETVTKEYLAFLTASDAHPTNRLRVVGTLGNSEGFSEAFNCPAGSLMNRSHKCNLLK
ncbi:neprilysin-4-like [Athalia rosae]|uniref:neprilysin-4-like n=1 Tax=Athalia rosae TaxID=37344 RepID=UPI00203436A1|nr:neprilysin-4-like [Athalia rosae]